MCGCDTQASINRNGAGAIAIIHTPSALSAKARPLRLFFSNPTDSATDFTRISLDSSEGVRDIWSSSNDSSLLSLEIHTHGDLTASLASNASSLSDRVHVLRFTSTDNVTISADLGKRLELGVGGDGVIGRMVSLACEGQDLGNGIIGWN